MKKLRVRKERFECVYNTKTLMPKLRKKINTKKKNEIKKI